MRLIARGKRKSVIFLFVAGLGFVSLLVGPHAAPAQTLPATTQPAVGSDLPGASPPTTHPGDGSQRLIRLYGGQSRIIDTPWPVKRISVSQPQVADVQMISPDQVQVQGKVSGSAELTMWGAEEQSWQVQVMVEADLRGLQGQLARLFPRTRLQVEQIGDVVVVRGMLARAEEAAQLRQFFQALRLNALDMTSVAGVQQVQLQVRVAEVSRGALRTLGINALHSSQDFFGGIPIGSSAGPLVPINIGVPEGTAAAANLPFQFLSNVNVPSAVTLFAGFPRADLEVFIQALQENTYLRLLAEPNLVALSGEEASFLAGGEFPIPIVQGTGDTSSISVEFKEFGVRLAFRPTVLGDGAIRLKVSPEVSELSDVGAVEIQGFRIPSLLTRRVETTLELKSGQTFGMAGLISRSTNARASKVPGLGELPILGALFRSVRYSRNETELVVLVTANLVEPLSVPASGLPVPGDHHRTPTPWEFYAKGRIEGETPGKVGPAEAAHLNRLGLGQLRGPGAWASHDRRPRATSRSDTATNPPPAR